MKRIWYALIIAVIITALCIFQFITIDRITKQFESKIDDMLAIAERGDIPSAVEYCTEIEQEWDSSVRIINLFINHESTDKISDTLHVINVLITDGDSLTLRSNAERIKLNLRILREGEQPRIENLL